MRICDKCEYCDFEKPKPFFETLKSSVTCLKSGMTGLPILGIVQYAYELEINIKYCPMCGRKLNKQPPAMAKENKDV